jgi:hypothetical protein
VATHDYVIANGTGSAVRSDLNNALAAIVSNNSSSTEPSTTYAFQWWADTNNTLLKIRNAGNSAWVTVGDYSTANLGLLTSSSASSTYMPLAGGTFTGAVTLGTGGSLIFEGATADANELTLAVTDPTADRTITMPDATGTMTLLERAQTFTKAQRGTITALTDGATITPDFSASNNFSVTLGGNRTLANPTNIVAGQSGVIFISQDGTGSRTLSYGSYWDFPGGTAPTLTTTASAVDLIAYVVRTTSSIQAVSFANFS